MSTQQLYTIFAEGIEVSMSIGLYPEEKAALQRVSVDISAECLLESDMSHDRISGTVSYETFLEIVRNKTGSGHYNLVERFCEEIASAALLDTRILSVTVRCAKPDVFKGNPKNVGVEIVRQRNKG
ncbi:MAG: dihydroneopterin aldolase [Alphaproteobacteria bacterium]|nr:dihydroneopterin aldolase [Alphaproteobacteria bacterium]